VKVKRFETGGRRFGASKPGTVQRTERVSGRWVEEEKSKREVEVEVWAHAQAQAWGWE